MKKIADSMNEFNGTATEWNQYLLNEPSQTGIFLQSYEWGEFQKSAGVIIHRFEFDNQKIQIFERKLPFRQKYWYIPRSRINQNILNSLFEEAKKRDIVFLRIEPTNLIDNSLFQTEKIRSIQPHQTSVVEIIGDEDEILKRMHQKTRYNIRLAQKKNIEVIEDTKKENISKFCNLIKETSSRNEFGIHSISYYKTQIQQSSCFLLLARYEENILASHIYWQFGDSVTYLHGASSSSQREVMAPYALHLAAIRLARERGGKYYDLWGIDEKKWQNLTRFKRGFGGFEVNYPSAFDIIVLPSRYFIYKFAKQIIDR